MLAIVGSAIAVAVLTLTSLVVKRRRHAALLGRLRAEWGAPGERIRDMAAIEAYYRACMASDVEGALDDRTWDDLNLADVFTVLDRTESGIGQQALYARLRGAPDTARLQLFEALVTRLSDDAPTREGIQLALRRLRAPAAYHLWRLSEPGLLRGAPRPGLFILAAIGVIALILVTPFLPPALLFLLGVVLINLVARDRLAPRLGAIAEPFRLVPRLLRAAAALNALHHGPVPSLTSALEIDTDRLLRIGYLAKWSGRISGERSRNIVALLVDAINMLLWLDVIALLQGAAELQTKGRELLRVIDAVGELDAALSIASYRAGTPGWTRPAFQPASAVLRGLRHPLLSDAVPNSITLVPPTGAIITGSNMSGKSTFLRTVGVNVVLAQTVHTCLASHYDGPLFTVRSCIGRSDDPQSGRSYYVVEVDAVLAIVRAAQSARPHLMLFDELFRGTNAVERLSAGEAVLRTLLARPPDRPPAPHVVLAATHDDELVDLLAGTYVPYHFTDTVDAGGMRFSHRLEPGKATPRNAIALLEGRGAPAELVAQARARVAVLDRQRSQVISDWALQPSR
ncbi:MAG: hypothetical protein RJA55_1699 [Acidobacteriota bacterium]